MRLDFMKRFGQMEHLLNSLMTLPKSCGERGQRKNIDMRYFSHDLSASHAHSISPRRSVSQQEMKSATNPALRPIDAIHTQHDVAAQKLFRWPSINRLLSKCKIINQQPYNENYVMNMETHRGPLRLYGRGQGPDSRLDFCATQGAEPPVKMLGNGTKAIDTESRAASSDSSSWGYGFSPYVSVSEDYSSIDLLKLDLDTLRQSHTSFMSSIHIMHPILDETWLSYAFFEFAGRVAAVHPISTKSRNEDALTMFPPSLPEPSQDSKSNEEDVQAEPLTRSEVGPGVHDNVNGQRCTPRLERSPTTALILLTVALGKICDMKGAIPSIIAPSDESTTELRYDDGAEDEILPVQCSLKQQRMSSRNGSITNKSSDVGRRNLDIIPGLPWYAQATDILGNLTGSRDLLYVQCCVLAGLYAGQLANAIESLTWIQIASRACCFLAKETLTPHTSDNRKNSIRLVFHTALQLESDILAEIDFPPSGIRQIPDIAYPYAAASDSPGKKEIMTFYASQLSLRNLLDDTQPDIYPPGKNLSDVARNKDLRNILMKWLQDWRNQLPRGLQWNDGDPTTEINHARLRGKYYGALYIIHRPMLYLALQMEDEGKLTSDLLNLSFSSMSDASEKESEASFLAEIMAAAQTTIKAAIWSTVAFDAIISSRRLIVTNVFGTAHAQFGNMLVLSAVYSSACLRALIGDDPQAVMTHLYKRTLAFLKTLSDISPTLAHDYRILSNLKQVVFESARY